MQIKKLNYKENKKKTLYELESYTKKNVPKLDHFYKKVSFIYEEHGEVLGRIVGFIHWDHLQIELFYVSEKTQGKGIGTTLLQHVESLASKENLVYILLETMSFNAPRFYEKNGYEIIAEIKDSPMREETRYFFKKNLIF